MGKDKNTPQTVTINDTEYSVDDLTQEQIAMLNHINDLGNKLNSMNFNRDQIQFGHDSFVKALKESLDTVVTEDA